MRLIRTGTWCRIVEIRDREAILRIVDKAFAYKIEGAIYSAAYRSHQWDGKIHLVRKVRDGTLTFPAGIFDGVDQRLRAAGYDYEIQDDRIFGEPISGSWAGPDPRYYQIEAADSVIAAGGGILKLPTRSGKTILAAMIALRLGRRAIFVVTSDLLLKQAIAAFEWVLRGISVTAIGDGSWDDSGDVVVASIQTLQARMATPAFRRVARSFGVAFFDEIHHLQAGGEAWRDTAIEIGAATKIGLSATVDVNEEGFLEEDAIWLRGICGPIRYSIGVADLVEQGFLVRPTIRFVRHAGVATRDRRWSQATYRKFVTECDPRNRKIADVAIDYARRGIGVLVDVARIPHVRILTDLISRGLPPGKVVALTGDTTAADRTRSLAAFRSGSVRVMVSTILGEGVDIPEIQVVINAEGGKARTTTIQRMRNLTPAPWKTWADVIEIADLHHPILRDWTWERLQIYKSERAFRDVRVEPAAPPVDKGGHEP